MQQLGKSINGHLSGMSLWQGLEMAMLIMAPTVLLESVKVVLI